MHVTREPAELRDDDRAFELAAVVERGLEVRPARERVTLGALDLLKLPVEAEAIAWPNCSMVARWASSPRPDLPCYLVARSRHYWRLLHMPPLGFEQVL
jgi:hypothetical protein